jgi:hypothetical protein
MALQWLDFISLLFIMGDMLISAIFNGRFAGPARTICPAQPGTFGLGQYFGYRYFEDQD